MAAKAEIRPGAAADLAMLVAGMGERHWFTDRLARQQQGGEVVLVAWLDEEYPDDGPPVTLSEVCDMLVKRL
jgi:hypothetical protein